MNFINEVVASSFDIRDFTIKADKEFPKTFSLAVEVPIKNQYDKPTCVAHALASLVEYHNKRQTGKYDKFSTEFIYGIRDSGYYVGDGMCIRDGLKTIQKYGDVYWEDCMGNNDYQKAVENVKGDLDYLKTCAYPHRISAYFKLSTTDEIKTALMKHGMVVVSMNTYKGANLVDDIYTYDSTAEHGRHCVLVVGWNEKGWIIQNSWGVLYGGDGRFVIPFDFKFNEMWGVTDNITELNTPKRNRWLNIIYKIINMIVNKVVNIIAN